MKLCRMAGWNQLTTDWERLLQHEPQGCFAVEVETEIIATATTTCYGRDLAWIGMMLVHEDHRRQGIAAALMGKCLDHLRSQEVRCIKLDATPAGKLVYKQLGFRDEWSFHRWKRDSNAESKPPNLRIDDTSPPWNHQLDQMAFGVDRRQWLNRLTAHSRAVHCEDGNGMIREGHLASYLGPVIAATPNTARRIIGELLTETNRTTFWDVPQPNQHAVTLAQEYRFHPVRDLTRMWTGSELIPCEMSLQYAISDPGTG